MPAGEAGGVANGEERNVARATPPAPRTLPGDVTLAANAVELITPPAATGPPQLVELMPREELLRRLVASQVCEERSYPRLTRAPIRPHVPRAALLPFESTGDRVSVPSTHPTGGTQKGCGGVQAADGCCVCGGRYASPCGRRGWQRRLIGQ